MIIDSVPVLSYAEIFSLSPADLVSYYDSVGAVLLQVVKGLKCDNETVASYEEVERLCQQAMVDHFIYAVRAKEK